MADDRSTIQTRMLDKINNDYDKEEGSFFYDLLMAAAIEFEVAYEEKDSIIDKILPDTAKDAYLDRKVAEMGVTRKPPLKATTTVTITGIEGAQIQAGDKVASDTVSFISLETKVIDATGTTQVLVECEEFGSVGNVPAETIKYFPVTLSGISTVNNPSDVTNGYDGESNDELRARYFEEVKKPRISGCKSDYEKWAKEVTGVGDVRVFPLWNGNGTVKVVILAVNKQPPSDILVDQVSSKIEEYRPIGALVTVVGAKEIPIDIDVSVTLRTGGDISKATAQISDLIITYLTDLAFVDPVVRITKIGEKILDADAVLDYQNLKINNGTGNIQVEDDQVAVLGRVSITTI